MPYKILIVDDDKEFRQEMHECLSNYRVIEAASGPEAIELLKKPNAIDLVILDVVMPQMSGIEALRHIKTIKPNIGTIMLTGVSSKDTVIDALKCHADDYLEKPFDITKLLNTVQRILDSKNKSWTGHLNKMERVKMFIENNLDKKISLKHLAEEVCLSPKYLSRIFKENTGTGISEYRLKIRTQRAEKILVDTDVTVEEVSMRLGYKNPESFIRIFKKFMEMTPTEYRLKHKNKKGRSRES